jgi:hypothetical protein
MLGKRKSAVTSTLLKAVIKTPGATLPTNIIHTLTPSLNSALYRLRNFLAHRMNFSMLT